MDFFSSHNIQHTAKNFTELKDSPKSIILIRHGLAMHNYREMLDRKNFFDTKRTDRTIIDAPLINYGLF